MVRLDEYPAKAGGVNRHIHGLTVFTDAWLEDWLAGISKGNGSAVEVHRDDALYKYMFTLLYFIMFCYVSLTTAGIRVLCCI